MIGRSVATWVACITLGLFACDKKADSGRSSPSSSSEAAPSGPNFKRATGTWIAANGSGVAVEIAPDRMKVMRADGTVASDFSYKVQKDDGDVLIVVPDDPKVVPEQFTFLGHDAFEMSRVGVSGEKFMRKK